jgi:hypothetical protein
VAFLAPSSSRSEIRCRSLTRVGVQALKLIGVDAAHDRGREQPLEEFPDSCGALQVVQISTREAVFCGVTVNVVTRFEFMSDSVRTRPGSGSGSSSDTRGYAPQRRP